MTYRLNVGYHIDKNIYHIGLSRNVIIAGPNPFFQILFYLVNGFGIADLPPAPTRLYISILLERMGYLLQCNCPSHQNGMMIMRCYEMNKL